MNIEQANDEAVQRMIEARPMLIGMGKAKEVIPGMREDLLLHAGPPITWERMSGPLRGAVIGALISRDAPKTRRGRASSSSAARSSSSRAITTAPSVQWRA